MTQTTPPREMIADHIGEPAGMVSDHAELARLAEEASEGPWTLKEGSTPYPESDDADSWSAILTPRGHGVVTLYERYGVKGEDRSDYDADAAFIAAANPVAVLGLISEIATLRAKWAEADALASKHFVALREKQDDAQMLHHRATEAERKLAEAEGLLSRIAFTPEGQSGLSLDECVSAARTFLSKEAERGQ